MKAALTRFPLFAIWQREFADYSWAIFQRDLLAGLTVGAVALPLALAFGVASGATAAAGLLGRDLTSQGTIEIPQNQTLKLISIQRSPSYAQFAWSSLPSQNYAVLYKATLNAATWTSIATNRSIGTVTYFTDTNAARLGQPQGYYKVLQLP